MTDTAQEGERWLPVEGWPYEVSDRGRVRRSEDAPGTFVGRLLTPSENHEGYETLTLCSDGAAKRVFVHRLVLEAFLGPCPEGCEADHINNIRTDNRVSNLRWRDKAENRGEGVRKLTEDEVVKIRQLYDTGDFTHGELAERYGVANRTVGQAVSGKWWRNVGGPIQEVREFRKLSDEEVREIRQRYENEDVVQHDLADEYDVSRSLISALVNRTRRQDA